MSFLLTSQKRNEALSFGWNTIKNNVTFLIGIYAAIIVLDAVVNIIIRNLPFPLNSLGFIFYIGLNIIVQIEIVFIALRFARGEKLDFATYKPTFLSDQYWGKMLNLFLVGVTAAILLFVVSIPFFILFFIVALTKLYFLIFLLWVVYVIGMLFLFTRLSLAQYLVIDKNNGPISALQQSWDITKGNAGRLFWFFIILLVINILGIICLIVGLFVTIPLTLLAFAYVYNEFVMSNQDQSDTMQQHENDMQQQNAA